MRPPKLCVFAPLRETLVLFLSIVGVASVSASNRFNFVFIQGEGQGWASTSVQLDPNEPESKSNSFSTPNLERLAREGSRFSNYYAPSPRCTPSRATYFTGISPARLGMTFTGAGGDTGQGKGGRGNRPAENNGESE